MSIRLRVARPIAHQAGTPHLCDGCIEVLLLELGSHARFMVSVPGASLSSAIEWEIGSQTTGTPTVREYSNSAVVLISLLVLCNARSQSFQRGCSQNLDL